MWVCGFSKIFFQDSLHFVEFVWSYFVHVRNKLKKNEKNQCPKLAFSLNEYQLPLSSAPGDLNMVTLSQERYCTLPSLGTSKLGEIGFTVNIKTSRNILHIIHMRHFDSCPRQVFALVGRWHLATIHCREDVKVSECSFIHDTWGGGKQAACGHI